MQCIWHIWNLSVRYLHVLPPELSLSLAQSTDCHRLRLALISTISRSRMNINKVENICAHRWRCLLPQFNTALSVLFMFWVSKQSSKHNMISILWCWQRFRTISTKTDAMAYIYWNGNMALTRNQCIGHKFNRNFSTSSTRTHTHRHTKNHAIFILASIKWLLVPNVNTRNLTNFLSMFGLFSNADHWMERKKWMSEKPREKRCNPFIRKIRSEPLARKVNSHRIKHIRSTTSHSWNKYACVCVCELCASLVNVVNALLTPTNIPMLLIFPREKLMHRAEHSFDGYLFFGWFANFPFLFYLVHRNWCCNFICYISHEKVLPCRKMNEKTLLDLVKRAYILSRRMQCNPMYVPPARVFFSSSCYFHFHFIIIRVLVLSLSYSLRSFRSAFFNGILTRFHQQLHGTACHVNIMQCNKIVSSYRTIHNSTCTKTWRRKSDRFKGMERFSRKKNHQTPSNEVRQSKSEQER